MARGSISHIALTVSDLERSTEFYNKVFGSSASNASKFLNRFSRR
jgi:predicted enzyme related to lactoylglutathione lyase